MISGLGLNWCFFGQKKLLDFHLFRCIMKPTAR
ncbi:hypothetical protein AvCA_35260 [Azotobacter vinelandii CA]|uniref:Uncharacterized protein n=2 Tax=Azotobacter vinelandii TaxID=354 RepID=C1DQN9_AZOVD|nr:hypothetical protein Avin_35260 [Azotobacter vinelandii DJ]AGK14614.1 hypothetical protein AvCA_35260 [Azotobacter vinelandii CA]AGK21406.1 hypothetical protein AvCA6_35260 [Azotobacter vinelandii CA6]